MKRFLIVLAAFVLVACHRTPTIPPPPPRTVGTPSHVAFDVTSTGSLTSDVAARASVTAYLIDDFDTAGILDRFLADFDGRVGFVLLDMADHELDQLASPPNTSTDLATRLAHIDSFVGKIVAAGGTVILSFNCAMPDFLSSRQGRTQGALSGKQDGSGATVSACSPVLNQPAARDQWFSIMEAIGQYFARYPGHVVYMFGIEPDNYFVGTATEMFDTYGLAISGLRLGDPNALIAGITPVNDATGMSKATATYQASSDSFSYASQDLGEPLLKAWIDYAATNALPLDFVTFHIWNPSSRPRSGGRLEKLHGDIDTWLGDAGVTGHTTVMPTDFAGWENSCLVDPAGRMESYYDSEYLSAMFIDHAIAAMRQSQQDLAAGGHVQGTRLVYGYLMEMQAWKPCMPAVGGLAGFPGMVTGTGVPKASYNALRLLTGLNGNIGFPSSDDPAVDTVAASPSTTSVSMLLSRHLPSELFYVAQGGGFAGYSFGSLFRHDYGFDPPPLSSETPSALAAGYLHAADQPLGFVHDLFADPPVFDIADLGLSQARSDYFAAVRTEGLLQRKDAAFDRPVQIDIAGLAPGQYRLVTKAVDTTHGNPYRARDKIQEKIDAAGGDKARLAAVAEEVRTTWGVASMGVEDRTITVTGTTTSVTVLMEPNSVWLVVLTAQ